MTFKLGMAVDLIMQVIFVHSRFDDLDLDARSQWNGKRKKLSVELFPKLSARLATTVGPFFLRDLDFAYIYILVFFLAGTLSQSYK